MPLDFNPFTQEFKDDPYAVYTRLRAEAPVFHTGLNLWVVSRYDDVSHVLKNPQVFSSAGMGGSPNLDGRGTRTIINTDPPDHTYLRNLVNRAFTPRMVAEMEPRIREITRGLIDRVAASGRMDLVADLAVPLPVTIIAEILGVEPDRRDDFKRWSTAVISATAADPSAREALSGDLLAFRQYFEEAVERRRRAPRDDLISALVRAEEADGRLTTEEIVAFAMLLLIAGNETTTNLIGNAMKALCDHPEQMERLREDPARIPNMVEEALRWDSPVQFLFRTTTQDTEVAGTAIPAGNTVIPIYASGNRDDAKFPDAARFDIERNTQGHLAFGMGVHFCLGAPLARLEAKVAFEELLRRFDGITLEPRAKRLDSLFLRGMERLPLAFEPAPVSAR
ncbi:MAG: cytochrome P450 [Chloroflexi bacterium]|nr:cytochrome P450 [Chloroflexota bacterium]